MAEDKVIYPSPKGKPADRICFAMGLVAAVFGIASLGFAGYAWHTQQVEYIYPFLATWVIAPPIWFWCEYFFVYRKYGDPKAFDSFKHGQQVSIAIWAALALFLNGLAGAERFKKQKASQPCIQSQQPNTPLNTAAPKSGAPVSSAH